MKETFFLLINYLKNPVLQKETSKKTSYKLKILFQLLIISILTSLFLTPIYSVIEELQLVDFNTHKLEEMFKNMGVLETLLITAVVGPIIEELLFRAPMTLFKKPILFKYGFYFFSIIFGFIHITNYQITTNVLLLSPILILPQLLVGFYFGYIRIKFGLIWSIYLHGAYNCTLYLMSFILE
ncbi:CPBP family intramembrane glutamic endopeptidase [Polaribacter sargassicola]|uniref:CPBP family intramembrane glutamic endopeptidase n=1 Tax=Polaribacter sargassicola TaxID=2836891 RepID=UPI001F2AB754|nr:CPBP family intramembrane glutamic endopeptidase [Polaribacter sp. DS7-9]MCG1037189.1 CPBP family intramembrane metalloprotease [Polaribacter sp. DS7-9]